MSGSDACSVSSDCGFVGGGAEVSIKFEIFKVDTELFQQRRQLSVLLSAMVLLVKHVSWYPTQQTNFHLSMYRLFFFILF